MGRTGQHYMTSGERQQLEALRRAGHSVREIAAQLGFCRQTIYNELKLGASKVIDARHGMWKDTIIYSAQKADQLHAYAQGNKGGTLKIGNHHAYAQRLEDLMRGVQADGTIDRRKRYSPAAALAQTRREGYQVTVCIATLYSYINKGVFRHLTRRDLWAPRRRRAYRHVQRIAHPLLPSIANRPQVINDRAEPGHWEMDLVVGRAGSRPALLTMTERQSRQEIIVKLPDKTSKSVLQALASVKAPIRSITTDNGSEFMAYDQIRTTLPECQEVYYCHSYASWEKGTNERHNRIIRQWFPKGTDFGQVTQEELDDLADFMNHYPRRVLGWKCPAEVASNPPLNSHFLPGPPPSPGPRRSAAPRK